MVWRAFVDESEEGGTWVLSGCFAPSEDWASFSREWEQLLKPFGTLGSDGRYQFHMAEMNALAERMERVPIFYKIIERYVKGSISIIYPAGVVQRALKQFILVNEDDGEIKICGGDFITNPYLLTFHFFMDSFHFDRENSSISSVIPPKEVVDFIFDERSEKGKILAAWDGYVSLHREKFGSTPRFYHDYEFLPLQAADLFAWWVLKWEKEGCFSPISENAPKFPWKTGKNLLNISTRINEWQVISFFKAYYEANTGRMARIIDQNSLVITQG